ncbi:hypothetical protein LTR97_009176 [Elasticomyces elasticus]|uniref:CID domain-containing protein n=1 Tax=Elasticomyces elasticus TaxID=574655 RepID=A0AAN7W5D7_9PEZI|nr:hypothetical protein LTR97_009176 [Elasticomyces elasticus]
MSQELRDACADFVTASSRSGPGEEAEHLIQDLHRAANICTRANVQRCSAAIIATVLSDGTLTTSLRRLLLALSKSSTPGDLRKRVDTTKRDDANIGLGRIVDGKVQQPPQPHFRRLHILYVVSDVLVAVRRRGEAAQGSIRTKNADILKGCLPALAALAVFTGDQGHSKSYPAVISLMKMWSTERLLSEAEMSTIYAAVKSADDESITWENFLGRLDEVVATRSSRVDIADVELPQRHGVPNDPTAPWHELPAANGLYMKQTRGYPLRVSAMPMGGYELDGQVDSELVADVQWLHKEMLHAFDKFTDPEDVQDIDALGNVIFRDIDRPTRNYWGWSLDGVGKMKEISRFHEEKATGYGDMGNGRMSDPMDQVNAAVDRARSLAAERAGSMRGRGGGGNMRGGRGGRGGRRW